MAQRNRLRVLLPLEWLKLNALTVSLLKFVIRSTRERLNGTKNASCEGTLSRSEDFVNKTSPNDENFSSEVSSQMIYLADHLSGKECNRLVASLHFHTFELPDEIDAAERRLPDDVPCIDLLTHWNATPREGKGETHVAICHRLNQIGRQDLAKWLSRTVSHELSKDLIDSFTAGRHSDDVTSNDFSTTEEIPEAEVFIDEAAWWELDSIMEVLIGFCLLILLYGLLFWLYLCCSKDSVQCYEKVGAQRILIEEKG